MGELGRTRFALPVVLAVLGLAPLGASAAASSAELALLDELNQARGRNGLAPLRSSSELARSARRYSRWQLRHGYFGHRPRIRMSSRYTTRGEVIRLVPGRRVDPETTVRLWLGSPGHRAAILHRSMGEAGAGIVAGDFRGRRSVMVTVHLGGR